MRYNGLSRRYVYHSVGVLDAQHTFEDYGEFIEFRPLSGLLPSARAAHMGDAGAPGSRVNPADILLDAFRFVSNSLNEGGLIDESRQILILDDLRKYLQQASKAVYTYIFAETFL